MVTPSFLDSYLQQLRLIFPVLGVFETGSSSLEKIMLP